MKGGCVCPCVCVGGRSAQVDVGVQALRPVARFKGGCSSGYRRLESGCSGRAGGCQSVGGQWGARGGRK